jgi:hypothetical protein
VIPEANGRVYASSFLPSGSLDEQWKVNGWIVFENDFFVHIKGASMVFPCCDIPFRERAAMVRQSLYYHLQTSFFLGEVMEGYSKLTIADPSFALDPSVFHCKLPDRLPQDPLRYREQVDDDMECVLLSYLDIGCNLRKDEFLGELAGRANLDFFMHMFGYQQCLACRTIVESERAKRRTWILSGHGWLLFSGAFALAEHPLYH